MLGFTPAPIYGLEIKRENSAQATLTWPTNAADWELETAAAITSTNWLALTNIPTVAGTNFSLGITTTNAQKFFRLHRL